MEAATFGHSGIVGVHTLVRKLENIKSTLEVDYINFQNLFYCFKNVEYELSFLLTHFVTFVEASEIIYFNCYRD